MRVLLIAPPWLDIYGSFQAAARLGCVSPPLGLMYLGGAVLNAGSECKILDMESQRIGADELLRLIEEYAPDMVGLTATSPVYSNARRLGQLIRQRFPDVLLGIGGVHATILGKAVLAECPFLDFQVCGEGEQTLVELIAAVEAEKSFAGIPGLLYREGHRLRANPPRGLAADLDLLPLPARHLLDGGLYRHAVVGKGLARYATIFTSRGCPFQCTFCSQHTMYGRTVRWHGIDRVVRELRYITEELDVHHVIFMDETLTLSKKRMLKLCEAIQDAGLTFTWEGWTHAGTIDEEVLRAMKSAGLVRLSFGIESGDPTILKRIKKGLTLPQIREAYRVAARVGVETRGSAILGHAFETRRTAWRTIRFLRSLRQCQQLFLNVACPYPGTELYECACTGRGGMRLLTRDYSRYKRYGDPVIEVNDLSARDLKRLQSVGLLCFYLTPRRIWYNVIRRAGLRAGLVNVLAFLQGILTSLFGRKQ